MKISKKQMAVSIASAAVVLISLALMICDWAIPLNIYVHPILTFLMCLFIGLGIICIALGFANKSPWYFLLSAILLGLSAFYIVMQYIPWWIALTVVFVVWILAAIFSFISAGNKTEAIALNKSPDYKNYEQRRAEKAAAEAAEEPKELPKIKSFKDNGANEK